MAAALLAWAALQAPVRTPPVPPSRVVAVGDVHGGFDEFVRVLVAAAGSKSVETPPLLY